MVTLRTFVGIYTEYWTLILGIVLMLLIFSCRMACWDDSEAREQESGGREQVLKHASFFGLQPIRLK